MNEYFRDANGNDSFSPLAQLATVLHEMFTSLMASGFTENQALYITSKMIIREDDFDNITDDTDR
jgi:hypothetical protein